MNALAEVRVRFLQLACALISLGLLGYAHVGIGGVLEKYLNVHGRKIRFEIGPSLDGASVTCRTAIDILLLSLELLNRQHKLCISYQITKFRQKLNDLR